MSYIVKKGGYNMDLRSLNLEDVYFKKKTSKEIALMSLEEMNAYYRWLRAYNYLNDKEQITKSEIKSREQLNKIIIPILRKDRESAGRKLTIVGDKRIETSKPKIFAVTHIGRYDIEIALEVIKDSNYFLMGDPGEVYRDSMGKLLKLKGVIFFDTDKQYKLDRKIAYDTCVRVLNLGGNIFLFPEAAWNITVNQTVMKLFNGAVNMSRETGAEIIPISLEQYGNEYYANIGRNIIIPQDSIIPSNELSEELRGRMANLKYEIRKCYGHTTRQELFGPYGGNYDMAYRSYIDTIMSEAENGYTLEEIERTRYKEHGVVRPEEVYGFQKKLVVSKNNAFLLKR